MGFSSGRIVVGFVSVIVCSLGVSSVLGDHGLLRIRELRAREAGIRARAEGLEAENAALRENVRRLRDDDATLERVARESQGLVKDGETVYRFPER